MSGKSKRRKIINSFKKSHMPTQLAAIITNGIKQETGAHKVSVSILFEAPSGKRGREVAPLPPEKCCKKESDEAGAIPAGHQLRKNQICAVAKRFKNPKRSYLSKKEPTFEELPGVLAIIEESRTDKAYLWIIVMASAYTSTGERVALSEDANSRLMNELHVAIEEALDGCSSGFSPVVAYVTGHFEMPQSSF